jgi:hypothetical protein
MDFTTTEVSHSGMILLDVSAVGCIPVFTVIKMRLQYVSSSKFKIIDDGWA